MPVPIDDGAAYLPPQYSKPGQLRQEYAVDDVLRAATEPAASILRRRPPAPQRLFPPRIGYIRSVPTIDDVLAVTRSNRTAFNTPAIEPVIASRHSVGSEW